MHLNNAAVLCLNDGAESDPNTALLEYVNIDNCMGFSGNSVVKLNNNARVNATMNHCNITNSRAYGYGGVITSHGGGNCCAILTMNDCTMKNCVSTGWGGAILWASNATYGSKLILNRCIFENNYARCLGGAISNEGVIEMTDCTIKNNVAGYGGGGIATFPFTTGGQGEAVGLVLHTGNKIIGNKTLHDSTGGMTGKFGAFGKVYPAGGGGLWILMNIDGWTCNVSIDGSNEFSDNTSAYFGGGVFLFKAAPNGSDYTSKGDTSLTTGALISGNSALSGGGIAIGADDDIVSVLPNVTITGGNISGNTATNGNGGGIFMPGGIFKMLNGTINNNFAKSVGSDFSKGNGGGFDMKNGTVTIEGNAVITENDCTNYGAGLYVHNTGTSLISTSLFGGTISNNGKTSCLAGGGICVDGNINFTSTATNIEGNNATNGGGICVINGARMLYQSGLIRNNSARTTSDMTGQTAYQKSVDQVAGIGGGVFVANNASLSFNVTDNLFGLYGNTATNGADDIFANGNRTSIALPDVSAMNLTGYSINLPPNSLYWVEDYIPNDANYTSGTQKMGANYPGSLSFKNWRYRYALEHDDYTFYTVDGNQTLTCYTALALGYQFVYITVTKSGMTDSDTALFRIRSEGAADDYLTFMLSDRDKVGDTDIRQKRIRLISGTWTVAEVDAWTWAYDSTSATSYTRTLNSASSATDLTFSFTNATKADAPPHAEDSKVNDLGL